MSLPTREKALEMLNEFVLDDYQVLHSKMVADSLEKYAEKLGEDKELWYITGLFHDLDYYKFPNNHPEESIKWFKEWGYPEEMITAIADHKVDHENKPKELPKLSAALIACDELAGLMYAYSLMRPTKWVGMEAKSVKKKFKDKAFAAKINRDDISYGVEMLGVEFSDHIKTLIEVFSK